MLMLFLPPHVWEGPYFLFWTQSVLIVLYLLKHRHNVLNGSSNTGDVDGLQNMHYYNYIIINYIYFYNIPILQTSSNRIKEDNNIKIVHQSVLFLLVYYFNNVCTTSVLLLK